jgi:hypothetical protein
MCASLSIQECERSEGVKISKDEFEEGKERKEMISDGIHGFTKSGPEHAILCTGFL